MRHLNIKIQLFRYFLYAVILFSFIAVDINLITDLPLNANIKWLFLSILSAMTAVLLKKFVSEKVVFVYFLFIIAVFMPFSYINGGSGQSFFIAFGFFALIVVTYILDGLKQKICIAMIIAEVIALQIIGFVYPQIMVVYDSQSRFYDGLIQVPIILIFSYTIVRTFANAYNESNKELFQYANYDMLTCLLNRWALNDFLVNRFFSGKYEGNLVFLDIDNFKLVNDKHGHNIGDDVLRHFGFVLLKYFDDGKNLICRWGGDEFLILFFDRCEKLEFLIAEMKRDFISYTAGVEPSVDVSVGITSLDGCKSVEDVFNKSEQLMYEQKNSKKV
ncbi:MAG: GGDEF domain-containing protein, partial [Bacillota bacterium]|nr:GGDEF domain-containing protein [Bacillota bacterium]